MVSAVREPKQAIVLLPDRNVIRRDWSGAFLPEATAFMACHRHTHEFHVRSIDVSRSFWIRRRQSLSAIRSAGPVGSVSVVAIFCHGYPTGIQIGFRTAHAKKLATAISDVCTDAVDIVIYACSTADSIRENGDGGFADALRDELVNRGVKHPAVWGHTTDGHTTSNPYVRLFEGSRVNGGRYVVEPGDNPAWNTWRRLLRDTDLRFRFPMMTLPEIHAELKTHGG